MRWYFQWDVRSRVCNYYCCQGNDWVIKVYFQWDVRSRVCNYYCCQGNDWVIKVFSVGRAE